MIRRVRRDIWSAETVDTNVTILACASQILRYRDLRRFQRNRSFVDWGLVETESTLNAILFNEITSLEIFLSDCWLLSLRKKNPCGGRYELISERIWMSLRMWIEWYRYYRITQLKVSWDVLIFERCWRIESNLILRWEFFSGDRQIASIDLNNVDLILIRLSITTNRIVMIRRAIDE